MQIKRLKNLIIFMLLSVLALTVFVTLVPIILNWHKSYNTLDAAETVSFTGSGTASDPYKIGSMNKMNDFITYINNGGASNKYFQLTADIDYEGNSFAIMERYRTFTGNFDGAGHTISNLSTVISDVHVEGSPADEYLGVGLFSYLAGGTIKNLKVKNYTVTLSGSNIANDGYYIGGIVGYCYGTIQNCEVEDFKVTIGYGTESLHRNMFIGGIYGGSSLYNYAYVTNCKANVETSISDLVDCYPWVSGIGSGSNTHITSCYGEAYGSNGVIKDINYYVEDDDINNAQKNAIISRNGGYVQIKNCNTFTSLDYSNLGWSDKGGKEEGSTWYYDSICCKEPYLRTFVKWVTYLFQIATYSQGIYKDVKTIQGFDNVPYGIAKVSSSMANIYKTEFMGQTIEYEEIDGYLLINKTTVKDLDNNIVYEYFIAEPIEYAITYNNLRGAINVNPSVYTIETETFTLNQPQCNGYTFTGWTGSNGINPQKEVTISQGTIGDLEYTANWAVIYYTIEYDLDGGELLQGESNSEQYTIESEDFTLVNPIKSGYNFIGWIGSNGSTPQTNVTINKGTTGNKNYTAKWSLQTYSITYNMDGGTRETAYKESYTAEETPFKLNYLPTKKGYTFTGWTSSYGINPQKEVTISQGTIGNLTYTANWEVTKITITFAYLSTATLKVNGVTKTSDYEVEAVYGTVLNTKFDGESNCYSYIIKGIDGVERIVSYIPIDIDYCVFKFNLPNEADKITFRDQPIWTLNDEDLSGSKSITITPTIEQKIYVGELT